MKNNQAVHHGSPLISPGLDLDDAKTIAAFCEELGVSKSELSEAVKIIGGMPAALRVYFISRRQGKHAQP